MTIIDFEYKDSITKENMEPIILEKLKGHKDYDDKIKLNTAMAYDIRVFLESNTDVGIIFIFYKRKNYNGMTSLSIHACEDNKGNADVDANKIKELFDKQARKFGIITSGYKSSVTRVSDGVESYNIFKVEFNENVEFDVNVIFSANKHIPWEENFAFVTIAN